MHGTPISGSAAEAEKFYRGRHCLVSFQAPAHMSICLEACEDVSADSGAYTAWQQGIPLDFDKYIAWVREYARHPRFRWALIPDVIDGPEWENDMHLTLWPSDLPGVPVYHLHESLDRLERLVASYPMVALGSSGEWRTPGTPEWWKRIGQVMKIACDEQGRPKTKLHGLRMLNPAIFTRLPLTSADSANVAINTGSKKRFGGYAPPSAHVRAMMIADRIESHQSAAAWAVA